MRYEYTVNQRRWRSGPNARYELEEGYNKSTSSGSKIQWLDYLF